MAFVKYIDILLVVAFNYLVKFVPIIYSIAKYVEWNTAVSGSLLVKQLFSSFINTIM